MAANPQPTYLTLYVTVEICVSPMLPSTVLLGQRSSKQRALNTQSGLSLSCILIVPVPSRGTKERGPLSHPGLHAGKL